MSTRRWRGWCAALRRRWRVALALGALAALGAAAGGAGGGAELLERETFPHALPHVLAHLLADFSLQPDIGAWSVVEDASNHTTWRYAVLYECGTRCSGQARVEAHEAPHVATHVATHVAPRDAREHRVTVRLLACTRLPLLPWPSFCDEMETEWVVRARAGGGAELAAREAWRCAPPRPACRPRARRLRHMARVRAALPPPRPAAD